MDGYLQSQGLKSFTVPPIGSIRAKHVDIDVTLFECCTTSLTILETQDQARDAKRCERTLGAFDGLRNTFDFAFM
jgi:hypothetical protein